MVPLLLTVNVCQVLSFHIAGEFGIVYRGRVGVSKREVAVKTLKGRNLYRRGIARILKAIANQPEADQTISVIHRET